MKLKKEFLHVIYNLDEGDSLTKDEILKLIDKYIDFDWVVNNAVHRMLMRRLLDEKVMYRKYRYIANSFDPPLYPRTVQKFFERLQEDGIVDIDEEYITLLIYGQSD